MLMKRLVEFHKRIEERLEPMHYRNRKVRWLIDLDTTGVFLNFVDTTGDDGSPKQMEVPYQRRSGSQPAPYLLADTPAYVLGISSQRLTVAKAQQRHQEFKTLVNACANRCAEHPLEAVRKFLTENVERACEDLPRGMKDNDVITFRVDGQIVTDLVSVRAFWQEERTAAAESSSSLESECLICGVHRPIASRHPVELHLGAERVQIVAANKNAFESFGLKASEIAPICFSCSLHYGRAADYLMTSSEHHYAVGNVHYLFWTRSGGGGGIFALLQDPQPEQVRQLLRSPLTPGITPEVDDDAFYALSVTANTSRLVVRDWVETTVRAVKNNLAHYFSLQELVGNTGEAFEPVGVYALATSTVRRTDDLSPRVLPALIGSALYGRALPLWLLHQAVRRTHADAKNRVTRPRAMLIKMVINSQFNQQERSWKMKDRLDVENDHPAYLCGRLLRVLEEAQEAAIPNIGSTIVDRFFATASTSPASVFGRLMRGAQTHLAKLRRDRPGTYYALQQRIEEVSARLTEFPRVLDLIEQGLFTLGYYHQRAADRAAAIETATRKRAQREEPTKKEEM